MLPLGFIWELTLRDFTERFAGSVLGAVWNFIWPLVQLFIYIIIFGKIMGGRLPGNSHVYDYGIYVACGLIPWTSFCNTVARCSRVFLDKKNIISKVRISLPALPLFICLSEAITFAITLNFLFAVLVFTGPKISFQYMILLPFVYYMLQIMAVGIGTICAVFTVFLRDFNEIVNIVLQLWFWFTPIVYVTSILPDFVKKILIFNPIYPFVETFHQIFVFHEYIPYSKLIFLCILSHLILALGYMAVHYLEKDIRDFL